MATQKITGRCTVLLSKYSPLGPDDVKPGADVSGFCLVSEDTDLEHWLSDGYVYVGTAEVNIDAVDSKTLVENKVDTLKAERTKVLAEAQAKATAIEGQIQQLLAITYEA